MSTSEPFGSASSRAALRDLNIPSMSAPDLAALPFARGGAGLDYAGIAAALAAPASAPARAGADAERRALVLFP